MTGDSRAEGRVGQVLDGTYEIVRKIDEGGMGAVYEARHRRLTKKRFAVKLLRADMASAGELFARFRREAEITSELGHPHIINVMDFNQMEDGSPYMIMEYLDGENLGLKLRRERRLTPTELAPIVEQVASGMQAAHDREIVHRDMKPENIFLVDAGDDKYVAKILDFGISKIKDAASVLTQDHAILGTAYFMSPEQATGRAKDVDHTTDIFALGGICYYALSGKLPFYSDTVPGILYQVCHHEQPPITDLVRTMPPGVDQVLSRALAKDRDERYQRASEFNADLQAALQGCEEGLPDPARAMTITGPMRRLSSKVDQQALDADADDSQVDVFGATQNSGEVDLDELAPISQMHSGRPDPARALSTISRATGEQSHHVTEQLSQGSGRTVYVVGAVLAAAVLISATLLFTSGKSQTERAAPQPGAAARVSRPAPSAAPARPAPAVSNPAAPVPAAAPQVRITLQLTPARARVVWDGEVRADNPLKVPAGPRPHQLRVEAQGYKPMTREVVADRDRTLVIDLEAARRKRGRRGKRKAAAKVEPAPKPQPRVEPKPAPKPAPKPQPKPQPKKKTLGEDVADF